MMNLKYYIERLDENHKKKIQSGFEKNDRNIFIEEILSQLGYSRDNIYDDVPQKGKTPDIRIYGDSEKKSKNMMSRFIIETKNYGLLEDNVDNIDFKQLKNYIILNAGKIKYIASTDYISFFLFNAEMLLNWRKIDLGTKDAITKAEIEGFKSLLVRRFNFHHFPKEDEQKIEILSHKNLFEIYDFPHPEKNAERFTIKNKAVRENFIKSLYYLMEEVKNDILVKFEIKLNKFKKEYDPLDSEDFSSQFSQLIHNEDYLWIRNLFFWAIEMNYIPNFFKRTIFLKKEEIDKILSKKNPESKSLFYIEYIITAIYSIINKTLFIRILEDSGYAGSSRFIRGEKDGRYLSNGIVHERFLEGKLKEYVSSLFEFRKPDLKHYHFLLKHDIYDWIISEIEEYTLVDFLRTFNEIYLRELDQDILGDIYEHYLQEDSDEQKGKSYRRLLGQYYTPRPIVRLMWFLVRDVFKRRRGIDLYKKDRESLSILDPFMGSGTFLNEAVLQMKASDSGKPITKGEVFYFFKDRSHAKIIEKSLTGFELNPLSCSIADINIYFRLIKSFSPKDIREVPIIELNLFRTNSFDLDYSENDLKDSFQLSLLAEEIKSSFTETRKIRKAKIAKYDIIIANPPYGTITPTKFMKKELLPFAYANNNFDKNGNLVLFDWQHKIGKGRIPEHEKNRGKLKDMYAFAFGVADRLIADGGIICFIVSNTYLSIPTYKWLRKYLLDNYSIEYIMNFNKTAEKGNSLFEPEAGIATSIIVLRKVKCSKDHLVRCLDLSSMKSIVEKYNAIAEVTWKEFHRNKNDIVSFRTRRVDEFEFIEVFQRELYNNIDYIFTFNKDIHNKIEQNSEFLENVLQAEAGVISGQDDLFVDYNVMKLETQVREFLTKKDIQRINKMLREKLEKLENLPEFSKENIVDYVKGENIEKYFFSNLYALYYDPPLLLRPGKKENKMMLHKLIVFDKKSTYTIKAVVTEKTIIPKSNNEVRFYYSENDNLDFLYYCCGILNSSLMKFYYAGKMGNRQFPIKKITNSNISIYIPLVKEVKKIQKTKSDYQKFTKGNINFESDFFKGSVSPTLDLFSIEEPNEYFDLKVPTALGTNFLVESPRIFSEDGRVILLNAGGLKVVCKDDRIARMIFERYFENTYGDLQELDISINMTQMDEKKITRIEHEILHEIELIERNIDILVYALYFDLPIELQGNHKKNAEKILLNENVKEIERKLN